MPPGEVFVEFAVEKRRPSMVRRQSRTEQMYREISSR